MIMMNDCDIEPPTKVKDNWRCNKFQRPEVLKEIKVYSLNDCHHLCNSYPEL